ncbi:MAG: cysteine desulfurase NifS [Candidatus Pacebacteria bacterium]|jgi:cysteine desulfurase|nr:cysteine desulfurase NifS [Candidatus Paceibacterota bacterium]
MAKTKQVYLDYAATTPVDPQVLKTMMPYLKEKFGNSVSLYKLGQESKKALEKARLIITQAINAKNKEEIIFTSSATESNNLALKGIAFANQKKSHIIISAIEHDCVLNSTSWLQKQGFQITQIKPDKYGLINPKDIEKAIKKNTILISIIHGNNEIGTIQPIEQIGNICEKKKIYFHTDAVQTFGKIPIDVQKMKIDLLTASSHKIYGPKGAGLLYIKKDIRIDPLLHGGNQEFGLRSSTVNVPAIIGFGKATEICLKKMKSESKRLTQLRDYLIQGILKKIPQAHLNGHPIKRLPNNANFWFAFIEGESIVTSLDQYGIAASTGSACSSEKLEPSHTLLACGLLPECAHGSLRLTLGRWTTKKDIDYVLNTLPKIIKNLRKISPFK